MLWAWKGDYLNLGAGARGNLLQNHYVYCWNQPLVSVDDDGEWPTDHSASDAVRFARKGKKQARKSKGRGTPTGVLGE